MKLKNNTRIRYGWLAKSHTYLAGTPVIPATNIPGDFYWINPEPTGNQELDSWQETYGFLVEQSEVS